MCGFVGIFDTRLEGRASPKLGMRMLDKIIHRGPDGMGTWDQPDVFLGHVRLSILDLSNNALQPLLNQDQKVVCVFNGEIYNYQEKKAFLATKGYEFRTNTDGEIIPYLYEVYGESFLDHLEGMFSIALYDLKTRKMILARDRLGIKPLYFAFHEGILIFGSEIKALLEFPGLSRDLDTQSIHDFLSLSYVPEPETGYQRIRAIRPRTFLRVTPSEKTEFTYFEFSASPRANLSLSEALQNLRDRIDRSVGRQLMSDVPIGLFLSGGIDSSLVTEAASRVSSTQLPSFCVKFQEKAYDESLYAEAVAQTCGTNHQSLQLDQGSADPDLIRKLIGHFDQPFADSSLIPTYLISKLIRSHVKVALSGDGGDEFFAGYDLFWQLPLILQLNQLPNAMKSVGEMAAKALAPLSPDWSRRFLKAFALSRKTPSEILFLMRALMTEEQKQTLFSHSMNSMNLRPTSRLFSLPSVNESADELRSLLTQQLLNTSLPSDMLKKVDMMSMLVGLEVRVPLLDELLTTFASQLPAALLVKRRTGKYILRQALIGRIPNQIIQKPKMGFRIPLDTYSSSQFIQFSSDLLLSRNTLVGELFEKSILESWLNQFQNKDVDLRSMSRDGLIQRIMMLLSLEIWNQDRLKSPGEATQRRQLSEASDLRPAIFH